MTRLNRTIYILACFFIVACGAGGSQTAGIDRGGVVSGPVTGYGSIWVNGSRYLTDTASITVNGATATEAGLAIGQVVLLDSVADENSLRAETIIYESNLQGPIESVDVAAATFVALLITTLISDALEIDGVVAWVLATLIVWVVAVAADWIVGRLLFERIAGSPRKRPD